MDSGEPQLPPKGRMRRITSAMLVAPAFVAAARGMYAYALVALVSSVVSLLYWTEHAGAGDEDARAMLHLDRVMAVTRAAYASTLVVDGGSRVAVALGVAALATYAAKCVVLERAVDVASPRLRAAAAWLHVSFHVLSVATEVVVLAGL